MAVAIAAITTTIAMILMSMPVTALEIAIIIFGAALEITITMPVAIPKQQIEHHEGCQRCYAEIVVIVMIGPGRVSQESHYKQGRS